MATIKLADYLSEGSSTWKDGDLCRSQGIQKSVQEEFEGGKVKQAAADFHDDSSAFNVAVHRHDIPV
jgi:hypothetical protein